MARAVVAEQKLIDESAIPDAEPLSYEQILREQGVVREAGALWRRVRIPTNEIVEKDGQRFRRIRVERRPVSLTLEEARETARDWFDPGNAPGGWVRAGRKYEREHPSVPTGNIFGSLDELELIEAPEAGADKE